MYQEKTLLEALSFLIQHWDTIYIQTRQGGKLRACALVEVEDQKALLRFVMSWLETWGRMNGYYGHTRREVQSEQSGMSDVPAEE